MKGFVAGFPLEEEEKGTHQGGHDKKSGGCHAAMGYFNKRCAEEGSGSSQDTCSDIVGDAHTRGTKGSGKGFCKPDLIAGTPQRNESCLLYTSPSPRD